MAAISTPYPFRLLAALAVVLFVVRLVVCASTGLADDEAYYRMWSLAPSLSYLDHPPMVAWFIASGRWLAGDTPLGIRLAAPVALLIGTVALWRTAALLYGGRIAERAVLFLLAMPLLAVGGVIITPDLPSVLFSGLVLWTLAELDHSGSANWLLASGLFAGLGLLSKYTNLFIGATILIWLLAVPNNRKWFGAPQLWIGGAIALLLAIPIVIWNSQHQWASFSKQFGRVARSSGGGRYGFEMIGGFVALASPIIAVLAIAGLARILREAYLRRDAANVLIAGAILPMFAYFLVHTIHDRVQANWLAPLYPPLAICAAIGLETLIAEAWRRTCATAAALLGLAMIAAIYAHTIEPLAIARPGKDPTSQMRGWAGLADAVEQLRRDKGAGWIATSSYATTGQLAYALRGRTEVVQLNERIRYAHLVPPAPQILSQPAIYAELNRRANPEQLSRMFTRITPLTTLARADASTEGTPYAVYLVEGLKEPLR